MSDLKLPISSRRSFLSKMMAMPFAVSGAGAVLSGCGSSSSQSFVNNTESTNSPTSTTPTVTPAVLFQSAVFAGMSAPTLDNPAQMATTLITSKLNVTRSDNATTTYELGYQPFFTTGDMVSDGNGGKILAGGYYDINKNPIMDNSVAGQSRQFFSDSPDGTSLLSLANAKVVGVKGNTVFAVVQFEYTTKNLAGNDNVDPFPDNVNMYGKLPSPIAVLTLDQDPSTGKLSLVKYFNVDTSGVNALWITCGSSLSPWNTHLSSEEYEPDAFIWSGAITNTSLMTQYNGFADNTFAGDRTRFNPYNYGHLPEVTINTDGTGTVKKHYCLGRISHELVQVMGDNRTVLMGDDATNAGLFMFVADKEKDLSAGTLYVAKFGTGFSDTPGAAGAPVSWIKLGHATSAEIEGLANALKPSDIMDIKASDPADTTYTKIMVNGSANWVKLKAGMEKAAAFLETHRYAALMGASMAFTKMEGTTVNLKDKKAYSAIQNAVKSMVTGDAANVPAYNIGLSKAVNGGLVLEHTMTGGQYDTSGAAINSEWVVSSTKTLLKGTDLATPDALGNLCDANNIAAPDNLKFSEKLRTLFIGEDSGYHVNNFMWAYNVDTKALARVASMPSGAESTGLGVIDDLNGWTYITGNFQHAGDWLISAKTTGLHKVVWSTLDPLIRANYKNKYAGGVGYITATPTQVKLNG